VQELLLNLARQRAARMEQLPAREQRQPRGRAAAARGALARSQEAGEGDGGAELVAESACVVHTCSCCCLESTMPTSDACTQVLPIGCACDIFPRLLWAETQEKKFRKRKLEGQKRG